MTGTVTIAPTTLDAAAAFRKYADERTADYEISSVSMLPGELCDYSGQELMGLLADSPATASITPIASCTSGPTTATS